MFLATTKLLYFLNVKKIHDFFFEENVNFGAFTSVLTVFSAYSKSAYFVVFKIFKH